jgi:Mor family transcriptional regulator
MTAEQFLKVDTLLILGLGLIAFIVDTAGGDCIYIPKRSTLERNLRRDAILREFDGSNVMHLSRKYGMSDRHVRTILQEARTH